MRKTSFIRSRQRGSAALIVTLMLLFAMLLGAAFVHRNLVFEQRIAANQVRSTQAFEAAEAGLEWALAMLNGTQRLGADCQPIADSDASSFRSRYLGFNATTARFTPTLQSASPGAPLWPSCVRGAAGWSCSCPSNGPPSLAVVDDGVPAPAFMLQLLAADKPGLVRVRSIGCSGWGGACRPGSATRADASAQLEVTLALGGGLRTPPAAALTTRGAVDAGTAAIGLHNADPSSGLTVRAGGAVTASNARLTAPAGALTSTSVFPDDAALAGLDADRFFASHFGLDKPTWRAQPRVARLRCEADCGAALTAAVESAADASMVQIDGDLTLAGPLTLGTPSRPVLLVVGGTARLSGDIVLYGVVHAASLHWDDTHGGAAVHGAAMSEGRYDGNGAADIAYDPAVLGLLTGSTGSFARVAGSWRDF